MANAATRKSDRLWASTLSALNSTLSIIENMAVRIGAVGVLAMMVIVFVDVMGRYLFNSPLTWSYDLISMYLMPLIIFLTLSFAFRRNQHISVDLLYAGMSRTWQRLSRLLSSVVVIGTVIPIAWLAYVQAAERYENKSMIAGSILWPTWIPSALLATGTFLLVVRALLDGVALVSALIAGTDDSPGESPDRASNDHAEQESAT